MKNIKLFTILLLLTVVNFNATAQNAGDNDPTFNPTDIGFGNGDGADDDILATAIQPDGKIIIGGNFTEYNGTTINRIARLNADGTLDGTFNTGTGANDFVRTTSIQTDGKIIIGGDFTSYNGVASNYIARLNNDGTLDVTFNSGTGANSVVNTTAIQADGKIIIGGWFTSYNGTARNRIARLNTDGTLDATFNPGTGVNNTIYITAIQGDGKIIIGGDFTSYNGTARNRIARLNSDGTLDVTFNPGTGANSTVWVIAIQPDGKIIIVGDFSTINGIARVRIARLNADGTLDGTFNTGTGANDFVRTTSIQTDGKIIIGGDFTFYNGTARNSIARLNGDGTLDATFNPGTGANSFISTSAIQGDGKIIIAGNFFTYNGITRNNIARLDVDGSIDIAFNVGTGANSVVNTTAIQADGKIIIGGMFTTCNGIPSNRIARLNIDGTLDVTFNPGTGANNGVQTITIQPDGKIIIGGYFTSYNGTVRNRIARLNIDGTLDTTYTVGTGANSYIETTSIQSDGKIIIGGGFTLYGGTARQFIARLNVDGTPDLTFNTGFGTNTIVSTTEIQADGKIIIGGGFTTYKGVTMNKIARLNIDATLDTTYISGFDQSALIHSSAIQTDGKIIIGGQFTTYNGIARNQIVRIKTDGSLDVTFNPGTGVFGITRAIAIQTDGKIIIGGDFTSYNGTARNRIARLNTDGTLDTTFNVGVGTNSTVWANAIQPDGQLIIGGDFTAYNGIGRNRIARILNCGTNASYSSIDNTNGNHTFTNTSTGNFNQTHWAFGDGTTSTAANPNHTFSANGTYVVVLTVNDSTSSSCMDYYLDTIVVTGVVAPLQCAAGFVMYPDAGDIVLVNSSTGTNLTYLWDFGDGNTSNAQFPFHTYAASGPYYLCLTIDDGAGCVDMYCDSIGENGVVFNKQTGFTINVIAPPLVTQISEQAAITSAMSIYPNPTGKKLNVVFNKSELYQLKIVAIDGKLIETKTIVGNTTLDVNSYPSGMYFITATNNEGKVYQSKFVKE